MGEHLEMHDEDVDGKMEVKEVSAAEEEPLLTFIGVFCGNENARVVSQSEKENIVV